MMLKSYRDSYAVTETSTKGGIWNIINALFFAIGFVSLLKVFGKKRLFPKLLNCYIMYFLVAWLMAIFNMFEVTVNNVFSFLMIGYVPMATVAFFTFANKGITLSNKRIFMIGYYVVAIFAFYLMIRHNLYDEDSYTIIAYYPICLLPLAMYFRKDKTGLFIAIAVAAFTVLFSSKRSGTLALLFAVFVFMMVDRIISENSVEDFSYNGNK